MDDLVVKGFDPAIINGVAQIDGNAYLERRGRAEFSLRKVREPHASLPAAVEATFEVQEARVKLASFNFDLRVPKAWRNHILLQFDIMDGRHRIQELEH